MRTFSAYLSSLKEDNAQVAAAKAKEISIIDSQIQSLKDRIEPIKEKISVKQEEIDKMKKQIEPLNDQLAALYKKKADRGGLVV